LADGGGNTYSFKVEDLFMQCENNNVSGGTIVVTLNNDDPLTISFPDCAQSVVSYHGVAETFPQDIE
jgi:hypothetical protein